MEEELEVAKKRVEILCGFLQDLIDREKHSDGTQDNTNVYWVQSRFGLTTVGTWAEWAMISIMINPK